MMALPFPTIGDLLRSQARILGPATAMICEGRRTSFEDLDRSASQVANGLAAAGLARGDRVIYLGKNSDHYFELLAGAAKLGLVIAPLNWRLAALELRTILNDAQGAALFVDADLRSRVEEAWGEALDHILLVSMTDYPAWRNAQDDRDLCWPVTQHDPLIQLYTSGTTGVPKGVVGTHEALLILRTQPDARQPAWNRWKIGEVALTVSPQFHIAGTGQGLQAFCSGGCALIMTEFDADRLFALVRAERPERAFLVPTILAQLLAHPGVEQADFSSVRTLVYGSSPMPLATLDAIMRRWSCGLVQQYGMTEIIGTATVLTPEDHVGGDGRLLGSAGRAWPGVEIAVIDPQGRRLPPKAVGEVVIHTPSIMSGYWRKPAETEAAFTQDGGYRTGDAGYIDEAGYLFLIDRIKDMIVTGGENVYPAEVETVLRQHPAVADVAVIGIPHPRWGEAVAAIIIADGDDRPEEAALLAWARERLAGYKLPKHIEFRTEFPRNASGKVLRRALRDPFWTAAPRKIG